MNFIEAVQALKDGRCESITRDVVTWHIDDDGFLNDDISAASILATDWQLVDPVPQYEDVEVVRFECRKCGSVYGCDDGVPDRAPILKSEGWGSCWCYDAKHTHPETFIKLTGTYRREVKKVKRREEIEPCGFYWKGGDKAETTAQGTKFFAEWEE